MKTTRFIAPIVCLIFSAVYFLQIFKIVTPSSSDILGPRFLPIVLVSLFLLLTIILLVSEFIDQKKNPSPPNTTNSKLKQVYGIAGTFIMLILYVVIIEYCGFVLTTFSFVFLFLTFFTKRRLFENTLYAAMIVAGFFMVFEFWLQIPFPSFAMWR